MKEQAGAGDLLQPMAAGFLGLLQVLRVRVICAWLPANSVELTDDRGEENGGGASDVSTNLDRVIAVCK